MKKIVLKILIICISLFCVICQISSNNVYADTIEEVKAATEFKTVEEDGEPAEYDILIDAKELISNEKLPAGVKTTIEDVLYDNSGLLSIDFFGKKDTNNNKSSSDTNEDKTAEKESLIRDFVRNTYRVFLYIAAAAMLVLLIYMSVVTVTSGISPTLNILPFSNLISGKKGETPNQHLKAKRLVEQWVTSVISLVLAVFVMNLIVAFSNNIVNSMEDKKIENETITVYVKNSKFAANAPILGGDGSTTSSSSYSIVSSGSSGDAASLRQKVVDQASSLENLGASGGWCQKWVTLVYNKALGRDIPTHCCAHNGGLSAKNASTSSDNIVPGAAVFSYRSSGHVIDSVCGMDAGHVGIYIGNGQIASCTGRGSTGITICTIDEWKNSWDFSCWGWLPGTEDLADGAVGDSTGTSATAQNKTVDYYFKTNLEGLLMFQSQYNSKEYPLRAAMNLISGCVVTLFKAFLYCLFVTRMLLLAIISAIAPIIILINSFMKISGSKGFLTNWIKLYMYLVFLRPVIAFFYYVLAQSNVYLISEIPLYVVFIIIIITIMIIGSIIYLYRDLTGKRVKNAAASKRS